MSIFGRASGLFTNHAAIENYGAMQGVCFDGFRPNGDRFHMASGPSTDLEASAHRLGILAQTIDYGTMPVTGNIASEIRERVEKSKLRASAAHGRIHRACDGIDSASGKGEDFAAQLENEAAQIEAALGQFTNGDPT